MKTVRFVMGAGMGDEGKGTVVAKYTKGRESVLNILTNGGSQRGHSVITDVGDHTFKHFGSGTYYGASNYYSKFFIINPMQFVKEWHELVVKPVVYRDRRCLWSTPFDMMANSISEEERGTHASCRMGIWNTIRRRRDTVSDDMPFDTFMDDITDKTGYLALVKRYYEKNLTIPYRWKSIWNSPNIVSHFIEDCDFMYKHTVSVGSAGSVLIPGFGDYIFESGQGLMLSDTGKDTPDTTPSVTGMACPKAVMEEMGLNLTNSDISLHYVTRPYLTRHGDGHLGGQCSRSDISSGVDEDRTNTYNEAQGEFRYAPLDTADLKERILADCGGWDFTVELTHCDEMDRVSEFRKVFESVETTDSPAV